MCMYIYMHKRNKLYQIKQSKIDKLSFIEVKIIAFQKSLLKDNKMKNHMGLKYLQYLQ